MPIFDGVMLIPFIPLAVLMYIGAALQFCEYWRTKTDDASKVFWIYTGAAIVCTAIVGALLQNMIG